MSSAFYEFLRAHDATSRENITNTRIGGKNIPGGSFTIPDEDYEQFLKLYHAEILSRGNNEYLTERQRKETGDGPILVDIDLRYTYDTTDKQYSVEHIHDVVGMYMNKLHTIFQFDEDQPFRVYVFEKDNVNRVAEKKLTKDGIHIIIGVQADYVTQLLLRDMVLLDIGDMWSDLPITNTWEDVLDRGISGGGTNWQLYGSRKPDHDAYKLTHVYDITYDAASAVIQQTQVHVATVLDNLATELPKMSARYSNHPTFFFRSEFTKTYEAAKQILGVNGGRPIRTPGGGMDGGGGPDGNLANLDVFSMRNRDELNTLHGVFLDSIQSNEYELRESYEFTMCLPPSYYANGTYDKWIRVGWALCNDSSLVNRTKFITPYRYFIIWVLFSAQNATFSVTSISDMYEKWQRFDVKNRHGLTKRSLMHWAKQDAPDKYSAARSNSIDYYIDQTLKAITLDSMTTSGGKSDNKRDRDKCRGCVDFDIATVLYQLYKDEYVCVSIKNKIWYRFHGNRWQEIDSGTTLNTAISRELRDLYYSKSERLMESTSRCQDSDTIQKTRDKASKILDVCMKLGKTAEKKNIMTEAAHLFFDRDFLETLDTNPYLLGCKNGVLDFTTNTFRPGYPDDHLSLSTKTDYRPLNRARDGAIIDEINDFFRKLLPIPELYEYMWEHLASVLIGVNKPQTMNFYLGKGQNGKSVLIILMEKVLGDYKCDLDPAAITGGRVKVGQVAPEIVKLKGRRYVTMQETNKGERVNVSIMKNWSAGTDNISARGLYAAETLSFLPQFKLAIITNVLMEIHDQTHGTWRRIRVVDFVSKFTHEPVNNDPNKPYQFLIDSEIVKKFDSWKEVFLAMLVDVAFRTKGEVRDCPRVLEASDAYRARQDTIAEFIREKMVVIPNRKVQKSQINAHFRAWYESTYGKGGPRPKDVHEYLDDLFGKEVNGAWTGIMFKHEDGSGMHDDGNDEFSTTSTSSHSQH